MILSIAVLARKLLVMFVKWFKQIFVATMFKGKTGHVNHFWKVKRTNAYYEASQFRTYYLIPFQLFANSRGLTTARRDYWTAGTIKQRTNWPSYYLTCQVSYEIIFQAIEDSIIAA